MTLKGKKNRGINKNNAHRTERFVIYVTPEIKEKLRIVSAEKYLTGSQYVFALILADLEGDVRG